MGRPRGRPHPSGPKLDQGQPPRGGFGSISPKTWEEIGNKKGSFFSLYRDFGCFDKSKRKLQVNFYLQFALSVNAKGSNFQEAQARVQPPPSAPRRSVLLASSRGRQPARLSVRPSVAKKRPPTRVACQSDNKPVWGGPGRKRREAKKAKQRAVNRKNLR